MQVLTASKICSYKYIFINKYLKSRNLVNYLLIRLQDEVKSLTTNDAVAKRINKLLRERKMTKYRLGLNAGLTLGALERILAGHNKTVTLATVYKLARGFDMTIFEFLDDDLFRSDELEFD